MILSEIGLKENLFGGFGHIRNIHFSGE